MDQVEKGEYLVIVYSNAFSSIGQVNLKIDEKSRDAYNGGEWYLVEKLPSTAEVIKTYGEN